MAPQLSNDVRALIVQWRYTKNILPEDIADLIGCSVRTVYNILERYEKHGNTFALPHGHRPDELDTADLNYLLSLLRAQPTLYLHELCDRLDTARGTRKSLATICRALFRAGWTQKAPSRKAAERNELLRATWQAEFGDIPAACFVWLDESGVDDDTFHRRSGRAAKGHAAVVTEDFGGGERVTMLPAMSSSGVIAVDFLEGGVTKERFLEFVDKHLVSTQYCLQLNDKY